MVYEYLEWIKKAERDFDAALYNLKGNFIEEGAFFLQQSAEKALKALFLKKLSRLPKTHDLVGLAMDLKAPDKIKSYARLLSPAYQYTRYPDVSGIMGLEEEIENLKNYCKEILTWVKKNL